MKYFITSDEWWEAGISKMLRGYSVRSVAFFEDKYYGEDLSALSIAVCCDPHENYTQRKRYVKAEKCLGFDVLIDFIELRGIPDDESRKIYLFKEIVRQTEYILSLYKKKLKRLDCEKLLNDFKLITTAS